MSSFMVYGIWCLCHPEAGVRYVGQTRKDIWFRLEQHAWSSEHEDRPISKWIKKHGVDNIAISPLEICGSFEELCEREKFWISELGTLVADGGLNVLSGGYNREEYVVGLETRAKLSAAASGRKRSPRPRPRDLSKKIAQWNVHQIVGTYFTDRQREIIERYLSYEEPQGIADSLGIKLGTVYRTTSLISRKPLANSWLEKGWSYGPRHKTYKLSPFDKDKIRERLSESEPPLMIDLADEYGVSVSLISRVNRSER